MADMLSGKTRKGKPLADGLSQTEYDSMMHTWISRFPNGLSGSDLEERFLRGGIGADLHRTSLNRTAPNN